MRRKLTPEEMHLWKSYVKGVKPIQKVTKDQEEKNKKVPISSKSKQPLATALKKERRLGFVQLVHSIQLFNRKELRHIKIDSCLDMHGMTLDEAYQALEWFLLDAQEKGLKMVLVITGKGALSSENTIRHRFPHWLEETSIRNLILSYHHPVKPQHGGQGAFYVKVKTKQN